MLNKKLSSKNLHLFLIKSIINDFIISKGKNLIK